MIKMLKFASTSKKILEKDISINTGKRDNI